MKDLLLCLRSCNPVWQQTGAPTHNGHKVCKCCEQRKPVDDFYLKQRPNGVAYRHGTCKKCVIDRAMERYRAA